MKLNASKLFVIFTLLISSLIFADTKADSKIELLSKENAQIKAKIDETEVIVRVNGVAIPQVRENLRIKVATEQDNEDSPELRKAIKNDLINLEVISQEAVKKGLSSQPEIIQQIELVKQSALAGAFVQNYTKSHPVTESASKQEYANLKSHLGSKEYKVAHILVETETEARSIAAALKSNGDFAKIATEKSKDPGSKDSGGNLGWTVPSDFVQPFGDTILKLVKGQISAPVKTQYGWHIIKLDDVRDLKAPEYEAVKANLEKRLQQQSLQEAIKALRANANIDSGVPSVNGITIPQTRIDLGVKAAAQQGQPDTPELRKAIRDDLINLEVISQEARKNGLDSQPEVVQQIELGRQSALAGAYVQDYVKTHPISEASSKREYDKQKSHPGNKEYKVAHILVDSEKEARSILAELKKKGSKFDKIATEKSKDPGSKDKGGDLGWTTPSNFVQPFGDAVLKLGKGQISAPVQTQFGWHIIKLDDVRDLKAPEYVSVRATLEKKLQQQSIQEEIKALRANADIK
jgi:peptidyl-prolyl cis-trans isomerase C